MNLIAENKKRLNNLIMDMKVQDVAKSYETQQIGATVSNGKLYKIVDERVK